MGKSKAPKKAVNPAIHDLEGNLSGATLLGGTRHPHYRNVVFNDKLGWGVFIRFNGVLFTTLGIDTDLEAVEARDAFVFFIYDFFDQPAPWRAFVKFHSLTAERVDALLHSESRVSRLALRFLNEYHISPRFRRTGKERIEKAKNSNACFGGYPSQTTTKGRRIRTRQAGEHTPVWHDCAGNIINGHKPYFRNVRFNEVDGTYSAVGYLKDRGRPQLFHGFKTDIEAAKVAEYLKLYRFIKRAQCKANALRKATFAKHEDAEFYFTDEMHDLYFHGDKNDLGYPVLPAILKREDILEALLNTDNEWDKTIADTLEKMRKAEGLKVDRGARKRDALRPAVDA